VTLDGQPSKGAPEKKLHEPGAKNPKGVIPSSVDKFVHERREQGFKDPLWLQRLEKDRAGGSTAFQNQIKKRGGAAEAFECCRNSNKWALGGRGGNLLRMLGRKKSNGPPEANKRAKSEAVSRC